MMLGRGEDRGYGSNSGEGEEGEKRGLCGMQGWNTFGM